jgi:hypothetical protein
MWLCRGRNTTASVLNFSFCLAYPTFTTASDNQKRCLYDVLGIPPSASTSEIKLAFKQVALQACVSRHKDERQCLPLQPGAEGQGIAPRRRPWQSSRSSKEFPQPGGCLRNLERSPAAALIRCDSAEGAPVDSKANSSKASAYRRTS